MNSPTENHHVGSYFYREQYNG
uniref:Uncharacterized protein n=1 Tax=Anguilla anguilla TaxID=7936 RepID=A0A0E9W963_ANGAN